MVAINSLSEKIKEDKIVFGIFFKSNNPSIAEMIGYAGFDFIIIDCEHGNYTYEDVENSIRGANIAGCSAVVRVPSSKNEHILHAADMGAQGIQIPNLKSVGEIERSVKDMRYYPHGNRGLALNTRSGKYTFLSKEDCIKYSNEELLSIVHIENLETAKKVSEICQIPQVDVLFIGPTDLSQSMGKPGQLNDADLQNLIKDICIEIRKTDKIIGILAANPTDIERYVDWGAQYIAYTSDTALFASSFREAAKHFKRYKT